MRKSGEKILMNEKLGDVLIYSFDGDLWNRCVFKILDTLGGGRGSYL